MHAKALRRKVNSSHSSTVCKSPPLRPDQLSSPTLLLVSDHRKLQPVFDNVSIAPGLNRHNHNWVGEGLLLYNLRWHLENDFVSSAHYRGSSMHLQSLPV